MSTGANSLEPFYDETSSWDVEEGDSREEPYPKDRSDSLEEPISEEHLVWDRVRTFSLCIECARHRFEK